MTKYDGKSGKKNKNTFQKKSIIVLCVRILIVSLNIGILIRIRDYVAGVGGIQFMVLRTGNE